jgi:hypothetical protein
MTFSAWDRGHVDTIAKIGFIVEGDTDKTIVESLARKIFGPKFHVHAVRRGGKAALTWAYTSALVLLEDKGYAHVIVVADADTTDPDDVERQRRRLEGIMSEHHLGPDVVTVCMAVPVIDAWLLARYYDAPETIPDPGKVLETELWQSLGETENELAQAVRDLDITLARRRSPSFDRFVSTLERLDKQLRAQSSAA